MDKLKDLITRLRSVKGELIILAEQVLNESSEEIIDLNQQQMFEGINPDGNEVTPEYSPRTIAIKKRKNQPFDRVTRKDTGSFYEKMKAKTAGQILEITSDDEKTKGLIKKYGDPFGLTEENKSELSRIILVPRLEEKLRLKLSL